MYTIVRLNDIHNYSPSVNLVVAIHSTLLQKPTTGVTSREHCLSKVLTNVPNSLSILCSNNMMLYYSTCEILKLQSIEFEVLMAVAYEVTTHHLIC